MKDPPNSSAGLEVEHRSAGASDRRLSQREPSRAASRKRHDDAPELRGGVILNAPIRRHPDALMLPALTAHTSLHIRGVRAVLEVIPAGGRQGGLQLLRPFRVGSSQPPNLIGSQVKIAQYLPERLTGVDRGQELLPQLDGKPCLCSGAPPGSLCVVVRTAALRAARRCAVLRRGHRPYPSDGSPITGHSLLTTQARCTRLGKSQSS